MGRKLAVEEKRNGKMAVEKKRNGKLVVDGGKKWEAGR